MNTQPTQQDDVWAALVQETSQFSAHLMQGGTVGDLRGISDREYEAVYALARQFYDQRQYRQAFKVFSVLVINNSMEPRFLMGLGACGQMLGRYQDALTQYMTAAAVMMDDPQPVFHSAQCLVELGHREAALETLELALSLCAEEKHASIADLAKQLTNHLKTRAQ